MNNDNELLLKPMDEENMYSLEKLIGVVQPLLADVEDFSDDMT